MNVDQVIKDLLKRRASENRAYQNVALARQIDDEETRQSLLRQRQRDDVALKMDFDTLEDRKRQQRLDNKVDNYLDNIEAMVRNQNKLTINDLNILKRAIERDVPPSDKMQKRISDVIGQIDFDLLNMRPSNITRSFNIASEIVQGLDLQSRNFGKSEISQLLDELGMKPILEQNTQKDLLSLVKQLGINTETNTKAVLLDGINDYMTGSRMSAKTQDVAVKYVESELKKSSLKDIRRQASEVGIENREKMNRRELINKIIEKRRVQLEEERQNKREEEVLNEMAEEALNDMMRPNERRKRGWREIEDMDDDSDTEDFGMNIKGRRKKTEKRRRARQTRARELKQLAEDLRNSGEDFGKGHEMERRERDGVGAEESKNGEDGEEEDFGKGNEVRRERREMARRSREIEDKATAIGDELSSMEYKELESKASEFGISTHRSGSEGTGRKKRVELESQIRDAMIDQDSGSGEASGEASESQLGSGIQMKKAEIMRLVNWFDKEIQRRLL